MGLRENIPTQGRQRVGHTPLPPLPSPPSLPPSTSSSYNSLPLLPDSSLPTCSPSHASLPTHSVSPLYLPHTWLWPLQSQSAATLDSNPDHFLKFLFVLTSSFLQVQCSSGIPVYLFSSSVIFVICTSLLCPSLPFLLPVHFPSPLTIAYFRIGNYFG